MFIDWLAVHGSNLRNAMCSTFITLLQSLAWFVIAVSINILLLRSLTRHIYSDSLTRCCVLPRGENVFHRGYQLGEWNRRRAFGPEGFNCFVDLALLTFVLIG